MGQWTMSMSQPVRSLRFAVRDSKGITTSRSRFNVQVLRVSSSILESIAIRFDSTGVRQALFWSFFFVVSELLSRMPVKSFYAMLSDVSKTKNTLLRTYLKHCEEDQESRIDYSWIERQRPNRRKINLPANRKSYDNSETTVGQLLVRRIQIFRVYFCKIYV